MPPVDNIGSAPTTLKPGDLSGFKANTHFFAAGSVGSVETVGVIRLSYKTFRTFAPSALPVSFRKSYIACSCGVPPYFPFLPEK